MLKLKSFVVPVNLPTDSVSIDLQWVPKTNRDLTLGS